RAAVPPASELPPVDPRADLTHAGSDQQPAQHAGQRLRNLVAKSPKQKLCGGLRHLDRDVADEAIRHHDVSTCAVDVLGFDVADESGHGASQAPARLPDQLVTLALFLAIAHDGDPCLGPPAHTPASLTT